jgi:hypothetical protein
LRIFSREVNFSFVFVSQLEPSGTNWIKTKENFASREKIRKWKTGFKGLIPRALFLGEILRAKSGLRNMDGCT